MTKKRPPGMTTKLPPRTARTFLTAAVLTASAAALAGPAHADGRWTATGTAACAGELALPAVKAVSPLPLTGAPAACGEGSLVHHGR